MEEHKVTQYDDYETSTRKCSCGASITWSGIDDRLDIFTAKHGEPRVEILTGDGRRAYTSEVKE